MVFQYKKETIQWWQFTSVVTCECRILRHLNVRCYCTALTILPQQLGLLYLRCMYWLVAFRLEQSLSSHKNQRILVSLNLSTCNLTWIQDWWIGPDVKMQNPPVCEVKIQCYLGFTLWNHYDCALNRNFSRKNLIVVVWEHIGKIVAGIYRTQASLNSRVVLLAPTL